MRGREGKDARRRITRKGVKVNSPANCEGDSGEDAGRRITRKVVKVNSPADFERGG